MFLHFAKLWNWEISVADNWYCPLCFCILPSYETGKSVHEINDTVPYVSTFWQVMKLGNQCSRYWYCPWCLWITFFYNAKKIYIFPIYETGKSVEQGTDNVPYVSTFSQDMKLGNQSSRELILPLMFLHFAKLWNWEISAADNSYCPLCFYVLPSYETGKSVVQITNTAPYVSTFCQVMKLEISAAGNWYFPLCFYILPSYETGKSVQQITDTFPCVSLFCQVMKLGIQCRR